MKPKNSQYRTALIASIIVVIEAYLWLSHSPQHLGAFAVGILIGAAITLMILIPSEKRKNEEEAL